MGLQLKKNSPKQDTTTTTVGVFRQKKYLFCTAFPIFIPFGKKQPINVVLFFNFYSIVGTMYVGVVGITSLTKKSRLCQNEVAHKIYWKGGAPHKGLGLKKIRHTFLVIFSHNWLVHNSVLYQMKRFSDYQIIGAIQKQVSTFFQLRLLSPKIKQRRFQQKNVKSDLVLDGFLARQK